MAGGRKIANDALELSSYKTSNLFSSLYAPILPSNLPQPGSRKRHKCCSIKFLHFCTSSGVRSFQSGRSVSVSAALLQNVTFLLRPSLSVQT